MISLLILAYIGIGFLFAIVFVLKGAGSIDGGAKSAGIVFRLMILPASTLLWPYLLHRWIKGGEA